ncbi:MAG: hypothetical protein KF819_29970 [Labilithrix sp.]|nr:hypothetical protein [Labilithrix sp.]
MSLASRRPPRALALAFLQLVVVLLGSVAPAFASAKPRVVSRSEAVFAPITATARVAAIRNGEPQLERSRGAGDHGRPEAARDAIGVAALPSVVAIGPSPFVGLTIAAGEHRREHRIPNALPLGRGPPHEG